MKGDKTFSNFDLLRKSNLHGKLNLEILTYESKEWSINTSLGYSTTFYKTAFRYIKTINNLEDEKLSRQLFSLSHGPNINFKIRPQSNFDADVRFSLEHLNYNDTDAIGDIKIKNDLMIDTGRNHFGIKYNIPHLEANFY